MNAMTARPRRVQPALFIDATARIISEVTDYDLAGMQKLVGGSIEAAFQWPNGDVLYVNEEGMFLPDVHLFQIPVRPDQPMFGNGVVVGREVEDETTAEGYYTAAPEMTADALRKLVRFLGRAR